MQFGNGRPAHLHHVSRAGQRFILLFAADNTFVEMGAQQQLANELALANVRQAQTIAALTQAQQLLRDSERELKRTHDLKSLFISKMSHEFGTRCWQQISRRHQNGLHDTALPLSDHRRPICHSGRSPKERLTNWAQF